MLHFLRAVWAYILSIFVAASPSTPRAPSPPTTSSPDRQPAKLQSILKRSTTPLSENVARREEQVATKVTWSPPPQIFVQDWSSVSLNMDEIMESCSTVSTCTPSTKSSSPKTPLSPALSPSFSNSNLTDDSLYTDLELGLDASSSTSTTNSKPVVKSIRPCSAAFISVMPKVAFPISNCTSSALSALSGVLWDSPSSHATTILPVHSIPLPQLTSTPPRFTKSSSRLPYPDLFDFNMYSYPSNESIQAMLDRSVASDYSRRWSESRRFSVSVSMRKSVVLARQNQDREHVVIGELPSVEQDLDLSIDSSLEERLEAACEDVTQFWTTEEFLVMLKEV